MLWFSRLVCVWKFSKSKTRDTSTKVGIKKGAIWALIGCTETLILKLIRLRLKINLLLLAFLQDSVPWGNPETLDHRLRGVLI